MNISRQGIFGFAGRSENGRFLLCLIVALALLFQGFVTQAHFHEPSASDGLVKSLAGHLGKPGPAKAPLNDDPANCPICQQLIHAGQFVAPAWLAPFLLVVPVFHVEIATDTRSRFDSISHSWLGRGPPHA